MIDTSEKAVPEISEIEWRMACALAVKKVPGAKWYKKKDDRATDPSITPEHLNLVSAEIRYLSAVIAQLNELRSLNEKDEFGVLRACKTAYDRACNLLIDTAIVAAPEDREIPYGCASTDSEGGVRIEWVRPTSGVHLVIPANTDRAAYIYRETGDEYATFAATAEGLADSLRVIDG
jgi:hypothetical protein